MKARPPLSGVEKSIKVHDYMIGEQIGRGSFAQIRVAFHHRSRNPFAVKVISKKKLQESKYGKILMFNETILARVIDHPTIIDVCEVCVSHSQIFQFMRLAEHGDLRRQLQKTPLETAQIAKLIDQLLSAVEYLHSFGICHRDIKLENILIARHTGVKLTDFGLASLTFDGLVHRNCGSFEYSAPEAITAPSFDGFKADMWSVGVCCYAMFARALPFQGVNKDFDFASAEVDYSMIPQAFRPLIQQLLSVDPAERPHATEARGFHALNSSQTRRKEPLSALTQPIVLDGALNIMTRLSQVLKIEPHDLREKLMSSDMNQEKVLFLLLSKRFRVGSLDAAFMGPIHQRSEPSKDLLGAAAEPVPRTEFFHTTALAAYSAMRSFVIRQRGLVSSPISSTLIIGQPREGKNLRILFNVFDRESGDCAVTFIPDAESVDLANQIMDYLIETLRAGTNAD